MSELECRIEELERRVSNIEMLLGASDKEPSVKMRSEREIRERIKVYEHLRRECKKIGYRPSQFWYQAKVEALLWVLGESYSRLKFCEWEEEEKEEKKIE